VHVDAELELELLLLDEELDVVEFVEVLELVEVDVVVLGEIGCAGR
jgi:hypothetical protein